MTDEKDLEYAVQHVCLNCSELGECDKGVHCEFLKIVRECYDDAIEIGRKETTEKISALEKENSELRARIAGLCKPPLYDEYSLQKENAELKEQIEKMKCPSCIWRDEKALYPTTDEAEHIICDECKNHSKWELAK